MTESGTYAVITAKYSTFGEHTTWTERASGVPNQATVATSVVGIVLDHVSAQQHGLDFGGADHRGWSRHRLDGVGQEEHALGRGGPDAFEKPGVVRHWKLDDHREWLSRRSRQTRLRFLAFAG